MTDSWIRTEAVRCVIDARATGVELREGLERRNSVDVATKIYEYSRQFCRKLEGRREIPRICAEVFRAIYNEVALTEAFGPPDPDELPSAVAIERARILAIFRAAFERACHHGERENDFYWRAGEEFERALIELGKEDLARDSSIPPLK